MKCETCHTHRAQRNKIVHLQPTRKIVPLATSFRDAVDDSVRLEAIGSPVQPHRVLRMISPTSRHGEDVVNGKRCERLATVGRERNNVAPSVRTVPAVAKLPVAKRWREKMREFS